MALGMNTLVLDTNAIKTNTQTSAIHTQASDFDTKSRDDCYSQVDVLTSENGWCHTRKLTTEYATPTSYIHVCTIVFSIGLNVLQVD